MDPGVECVVECVADVAAMRREIAALKLQCAEDARAVELRSAEEQRRRAEDARAVEQRRRAEDARAVAQTRARAELQLLDETLKDTGIERKGLELLDSTATRGPVANYSATLNYGARVSKVSALVNATGERLIAVDVKYIKHSTSLSPPVYHQYAIVTGVATDKTIYKVNGIHSVWLGAKEKVEASNYWSNPGPVAPPAPGGNYAMFDLDKQTLSPIYTFDAPLATDSGTIRMLRSMVSVAGGHGPFPNNDNAAAFLLGHMHLDLIINRVIPGGYVNGPHWERLGGLFGPYYNAALNEWRCDAPPLEPPSTTPRGALVFRGAAAGAAHAAQPARCVAPAPRPMSTDSDDVPPRDAAYVYKIKIDRLTDAIAVVERELRASDPAILLKEVAQLRGALEKRYVDYENACNRCSQQCAGVGDRTFIREHPEKVRATNYEITAKLDLVGTHGELKEKLATLTAERNQLRAKQQRLNYDESTPSGALVFRDAAAP